VLAFAGIGDPERFFRTLRNSGIDVVRTRPFADHHVFSADEIEELLAQARSGRLTLATTEKDLARLRGKDGLPDWAAEIAAFAVKLEFAEPEHMRKFISARLFKARENKFGSR